MGQPTGSSPGKTASGQTAPPGAAGFLRFDATGESLGPGMTAAQFTATKVGNHAATHFTGDGARIALGHHEIGGRRFDVTVKFMDGKVAGVELFAPLAGDGKDWSDWTLKGEMERKRVHEEWAAAYFGRAMEPKPIEMEGLNGPVVPFEITGEYPRHAKFAWGEVASWYDSKGGQAWMSVVYG
ncbi:MAG: hypothetical protein ACREJO_05410 [Phycisphaerales bacterium]